MICSETLKSLKLPEEIGYQAFHNCKKLSKVTFPSSLKYIGSIAFSGSKVLEKITPGANMEYIDSTAFKDCAKKMAITALKGSFYIRLQSFPPNVRS